MNGRKHVRVRVGENDGEGIGARGNPRLVGR